MISDTGQEGCWSAAIDIDSVSQLFHLSREKIRFDPINCPFDPFDGFTCPGNEQIDIKHDRLSFISFNPTFTLICTQVSG